MNDRKQLDCQLNCKATAELKNSVAEDMLKEDRNLSDLLGEEEHDSTTEANQHPDI
jgi:hypothetical protein